MYTGISQVLFLQLSPWTIFDSWPRKWDANVLTSQFTRNIDLFPATFQKMHVLPSIPRIHYLSLPYLSPNHWIHTYARLTQARLDYFKINPVVSYGPKREVIHHGFKNNEKALLIMRRASTSMRYFSDYIILLSNKTWTNTQNLFSWHHAKVVEFYSIQDQQRFMSRVKVLSIRMVWQLKKDGGLRPLSIFRQS